MSHFPFMDYVVLPVIQVGRTSAAVEKGCREPRVLSDDDYHALSAAAPLTAPELAAVLTGRWPFEFEPGDDITNVQDHQRVLARIEEAQQRGQLPKVSTLKEGLEWAMEVGVPMVNQSKLQLVIGATTRSTRKPNGRSDSKANFDPELQKLAEETVAAMKAKNKRFKPNKAQVVDAMKQIYGLTESESSIARRTRGKPLKVL